MELRSSGPASTKYDGDRNATTTTGSDSGTSSGSRSRGTRSASSNSASSSGRRTSPDKRQATSKSTSSCSDSEHCSKNDKPVSQRDGSTSHDSTNGQVMCCPGNSSTSSVQSRQRDALMYVFLFSFRICQQYGMVCVQYPERQWKTEKNWTEWRWAKVVLVDISANSSCNMSNFYILVTETRNNFLESNL